METEEDNYYDIEKWLCLDKELSYCLNIAKICVIFVICGGKT